jgi:hypothetical protein
MCGNTSYKSIRKPRRNENYYDSMVILCDADAGIGIMPLVQETDEEQGQDQAHHNHHDVGKEE